MPRVPRGATGSNVVHVLNRGNNRMTLFSRPEDYRQFLALFEKTRMRYDLSVYAFALMPNHFHLVAHPDEVAQLSGFMQSWLTTHARRFHKAHGTSGHVWQGRFKSFPIQADEHLLTVLRYVLLNPVRAGLAADAFLWPWSSLNYGGMATRWPLAPPKNLAAWLADGLNDQDLAAVRASVERRTPFGGDDWRQAIAERAGLEPTLRNRGRPSNDEQPYRFVA